MKKNKVSISPKQKFYNSSSWRKTRKEFIKASSGFCEMCLEKDILKPTHTVHHKNHLTIYDYKTVPLKKCFGFENLQGLCFECHQKVHNRDPKKPKYTFSENGDLI